MSFFLTEEAIHLPPTLDPDKVGVLFWAEKTRAWALELERARTDKQKRKNAWVKMGKPLSLDRGDVSGVPPHLPVKYCLFPRRRD